MAQEKSKVSQIIGEFVLMSPMPAASHLFGLLPHCILATLLILFFKQMYTTNYHADKGEEWKCIAVSYLALLCCIAVAYLFWGDYIIVVVFTSLISYASAQYGKTSAKAKTFDIIKPHYNEMQQEIIAIKAENSTLHAQNAKPIECMTAQEFELLCASLAVKVEYRHTAWLIYHEKLKGECLYNAAGYSKRQIIDIRKYLVSILGEI